jgi:hypothetical protein
VAVRVTVQVVRKDLVETVNVAVVAPAGIVTLAGTLVTMVLLVLSETANPPVGAGPVNVTVPFTDVPPATRVGLRDSDDISATGAVMIRAALLATPL